LLAGASSLKRLAVWGASLRSAEGAALFDAVRGRGAVRMLEDLDVSGNAMGGGAGAAALAGLLAGASSLKRLAVWGASLGSEGAAALFDAVGGSGAVRTLEELDVNGNEIGGGAGAAALARLLAGASSLKRLLLWEVCLGSEE